MKQTLKQTINIAAVGWQHEHWLSSFYPDDLPQDWQLSYYSNEFNAVLVPTVDWQADDIDCEQWLDNVHPDFKFYVQLQAQMFEHIPVEKLLEHLKVLKPQLAALVFDGDALELPEEFKAKVVVLVEALDAALFGLVLDGQGLAIWQWPEPEHITTKGQKISSLACIKSELTDLRAVRPVFEAFIAQADLDQADTIQLMDDACIVVKHPQLQVVNMKNARSMLEIMGY